MSHYREILDVVELCEEQGFRVKQTGRGAGGWQIFPKDHTQPPVSIYNTSAGGSSQTRYLNIRSQLRRIGVVFPELEKKTKEPTVAVENKPQIMIGVAKIGTLPAPPEKVDPAEAMERLRLAVEAVQLAVMELELAATAATAANKSLIAVSELIKQIRG